MYFFCGTSHYVPTAVSQKLVRLIETDAKEMSQSNTGKSGR